ncbi:peptide chain release factor N(5)-glutamine methyltransferase [Rugosimonospora acidiphila]|uniref:Release factor glutamine methyltransferase n=1 Tax=Rugosimonospora acidiphila TaxID=556531 RepID=A0ABP9RNJ2_9ACTN
MSQVHEAIAEATRKLAEAGIDSARVDAELLAEHAFGVPRGRLAVAPDPEPQRLDLLWHLVAERATRVPVQYLTGLAPFRYLELVVGPGVFVPRPETELLVDWGLERLAGIEAPVVVDLASGTGAIALSVATECPAATVYAVERSPRALDWLRRNAGNSGVRVVEADVTAPATLAELDGRVDLVLCNPPYVPDASPVAPEVSGHEPTEAVFGGPDGLDVIRPVIARAAGLLRGGGAVGIEHDDSHGEAVPTLLRADGRFAAIADHRDLAGRPRFATATRLADCNGPSGPDRRDCSK